MLDLALLLFIPLFAPAANAQEAFNVLAAQAPAAVAAPEPGAPVKQPPPVVDLDSPGAIAALSKAEMAAATPAQRLAMLKTLMKHSSPSMNSDGSDWRQQETEDAIYRLFASAPDAAAFDGLYYHVRKLKLRGAVSRPSKIDDMARGHLAATVPGDWAGLGSYIDQVTGSSSSGLNKIDFLIDGAVLPAAEAAIRGARHSIHIEVYQLQADDIGWALARLLAEKAREGVQVRLLVDFYGSGVKKGVEIQKLLAFLRESGAEARTNDSARWTGSRDHRKVMVVDGVLGFTGGMNIGGHYQVDWHDQQSRIEGPVVARLQDSFLEQWAESGGGVRDRAAFYPELKEIPGGAEARVVYHTGNTDRNIKAMYLRAFLTAQKSIRAAAPYFADPDVVDALCAAAYRGVKVQLVFPALNNKAIAMKSSRSFYPELLAAGVEIYEYQGRMAHQKVATIDGVWSSFGSSNLDSRSLKNNHELNVVTLDSRLAEYIGAEMFDKDIPQSRRITEYRPTFMDKVAGKLYPWL
ncbi:MAG: hypothetical protein A2049_05490 [Elusimicrobia bacterium GWA2_62_23]|nr:MAG: hypothetical protein A2049_05490 [Elusimicrobia bacterium GWA2_62_23]